ncbi:hypothetical protein MSAN_02453000 [Mycena sanguinolenta]|uniref:Uncharacterized protein n=1 Tax=Mycena sanguinolenta TaxID=230812 RepID=A0A8H6WY94_9AGAR|nr:hypothetical protein MSAN_02453000 [Mycena sanguinolenta]
MDGDQPNPTAESTHSTTGNPEFPSHASGMFSHSQHFTIIGGTFTNITNNYYAAASSLPSDFRMIPLGDIDLRWQIRVDEYTGVARSQRQRACVRRIHSAKARIDGRRTRVTVAMYQGNGAEEAVRNYISSEFHRDLASLSCTNWIRCSTGRLCTDLTQPSTEWISFTQGEFPGLPGIYAMSASHTEASGVVIDSLTLQQYHLVCYDHLVHTRQRITISTSTTVNLGAVFDCSSNPLEDAIEISFLPSAEAHYVNEWMIVGGSTGEGTTREIMPHGWTRFQSSDVINSIFCLSFDIPPNPDTWLSQANHIFRRLNIMSNFGDYVALDHLEFVLGISAPTGDPPVGFLFLCPEEDFQTGPASFCFPASSAYWSLDPSGVDRLSPEEATRLGFPSFELSISAAGVYWDSSVYEGLRQFHEANGFDPYSQDVARHLGEPLYQVCPQADAPFAYINSEDENFDADVDSDCNSLCTDEYESECPPTSACDDSDGGNCGPGHAEIANCKNHTSETSLEDMLAEEVCSPSRSLNVLMGIQLVAILFLGLSWVYDHISVSFV